ncbi:hypothetical protein U737_05135 [Methylomonas sp. LW13]|uniref:hypothetical protein n=1 Tax=unclassified Methylomonas TaxID=2608980 RepID=UPI00051B0057|nr:hypothetical protein [Methylomonas sp. LW13]QBC26354.1 hypothetical protein U737_05135 [Methylomonas sp. LW13]
MSKIATEVYELLKNAGVSECKAFKAVEAIQQHSKENRLHFVQKQMLKYQIYTEQEFKTLKWTIGVNLVFTVVMFLKLLS